MDYNGFVQVTSPGVVAWSGTARYGLAGVRNDATLYLEVRCMCNVQNLRRRLDKIGYSLVKLGCGSRYGYVIVSQNNCVIAGGGSNYGLTLDEVSEWLSDE